MSRADAAWLHMEDPSNLMMITALFTFKGRLDPAVMRAMLEEKLMAYDRFRMRVGYPKIGIGRPEREAVSDFVLMPFPDDHWQLVQPAITTAAEAVLVWAAEGIAAAMNRFNMTPSS